MNSDEFPTREPETPKPLELSLASEPTDAVEQSEPDPQDAIAETDIVPHPIKLDGQNSGTPAQDLDTPKETTLGTSEPINLAQEPSVQPWRLTEGSAQTNSGSSVPSHPSEDADAIAQRIAELQRQEAELKRAIATLQETYTRKLQEQMSESQAMLARVIQEGVSDLERRRNTLRIEVEQLERRQDRIRAEMRRSFAGVSQDLAIRVQGFKDYLVGSLQDLAAAAEQLELVPPSEQRATPPAPVMMPPEPEESVRSGVPKFTEDRFQDQTRRVRSLLDQYRTRPDYYGPPWQLRRTFEPVHAERVSSWFFEQGGRGALRTMGSRLQNILIASAVISVLKNLYTDRLQTLVLIDSPERLGEWRRGLQDCLGISRTEFGVDRGVVLFEDPEPLAQRADRLLKSGQIPLIIIDESEDKISLSVLQFPLWLAFAPDPLMPKAF